MPNILYGKKLSDQLAHELAGKIENMAVKPKLVIVQIGDLEESNTYIKNKKLFGTRIGALVEHKKYPENVSEGEVIADIKKYNADQSIHGIMIQLPIPENLDATEIVETINYRKDVDGLTSRNMKLLFDNKDGFVPATSKGVITLLEHYGYKLAGKKVVIVGESVLVGRPTSLAFLNEDSTVTICNSHTQNLEEETKRAEILVVAVGHPALIGPKHVSKDQTVVDIGFTVKDSRVLGDVDFEKVKDIVSAITPVPGGVGPMTVYSLFENLIKAYSK